MAYCIGSFVSEDDEEVNTVIKETNPKLLTSVYLSSVSEADPLFGSKSEFLNVYHDRPTDWAIDYTKSNFKLRKPTKIKDGIMKTGVFRCALKRPYHSKIKDFDFKLGQQLKWKAGAIELDLTTKKVTNAAKSRVMSMNLIEVSGAVRLLVSGILSYTILF